VFAHIGEVRTISGREMTRDVVKDAEVVLVRSITQVNAALLEGSKVRFVATATIGVDHVDQPYLADRGIGFSSAPGSNAQSVAEYICSALVVLESRGLIDLNSATIGIVVVGNVGSRVERVCRTLGMNVLLNDPPRARREGPDAFVDFETIAAQADVVTCHVPLEKDGADPTYHLVDDALIARLKPGVIVFNSSRGAVADGQALKDAKSGGKIKALVLDVFENEPAIDLDLLMHCDLATPHIAGYSYDGKVAGTRMIYEAGCAFLQIPAQWPAELPPDDGLSVEGQGARLRDVVLASYDIEADDARMREALGSNNPDGTRTGAAFDRLRKEYPRRREFARWRVDAVAEDLRPVIAGLGFRTG
jgi:erythronate-4-phosphate dehydrogenase